ncbi:cell division protein FtsH [Porphyromonas canoris]|uniref:ATP-dependent zinc metalloprotease FtsH n=1 Tax=Porphyromonas canoris TaxID=36875 RepID=UPI00051CE11A|nr:cell division protein FtsH [Porphyromonas canoris]
MNGNTNNNRPQGPNSSRGRNPMKGIGFGWIYVVILIVLGTMFLISPSPENKMDWSEFQSYMDSNSFESITVYTENGEAVGTLKKEAAEKYHKSKQEEAGNDDSIGAKRTLLANNDVTTEVPGAGSFEAYYQKLKEADKLPDARIKYINPKPSIFQYIFSSLPLIILIGFWIFVMSRMSGAKGGGGGIFNVGKSNAQLFDRENKVRVTFSDVAGLSEAKTEIEEIVHFLKEPKRYTHLGGKIPKGALLVGPPGTGKTLLAKAVAGEANVPFFSLSGSDFVEMFVGVGASRVRDLFKQAKEKAPSIIFIDEIDAIGRARGKNAGFGGNDERENTLNQLLTEMDGFDTNSGVIILAATNRADILDKALLRAGRFDRQIHVDLPDLNDRKEIFKVHMKRLKMDESVDIDLLSRQTPGFSGADIANVCNEAALIAARNGKDVIQRVDFMNAVDRIVGGLERKSKITTSEEKRSIAIHEAGHATISWLLEHANPLIKVTIVPRGRALGAAWYLPEERQITTTEQLLDEMCALLGGRAAEEVVLGRISTGASNDLQRVTKMAQAMITYFGMSKTMPNINFQDSQNEYGFTKPFSEETARKIDEEILELINEQYDRAKQILRDHKDGHAEIAQLLLTNEVIYTDDVARILGERPWKSRTEELLSHDIPEDKVEPKEEEISEQKKYLIDR